MNFFEADSKLSKLERSEQLDMFFDVVSDQVRDDFDSGRMMENAEIGKKEGERLLGTVQNASLSIIAKSMESIVNSEQERAFSSGLSVQNASKRVVDAKKRLEEERAIDRKLESDFSIPLKIIFAPAYAALKLYSFLEKKIAKEEVKNAEMQLEKEQKKLLRDANEGEKRMAQSRRNAIRS